LKLDALGKKSRIDREQKGFKSGDWRRISSKFFPIIFSNYYPYIKYFRGKKFKFKPKKFAFVKINLEENVKKSLFETLYRAFLRKEMGGEWHYRLFVGRLLAQKLSKTANTTLLTSELAKEKRLLGLSLNILLNCSLLLVLNMRQLRFRKFVYLLE
jgi:hypothetical protein